MTDEQKKPSLMGTIMKYLIPLVITVGLCWVMFRSIDFSEMMAVIRDQCNFWWIALALFVSVFSHIFRAMRWRIQLDALGVRAPLFNLVLSIFGTYAVNLVFPRLGEVWRCGYIAQRQDSKFATVFGSMVADRLADTVTVATLVLVTLIVASKTLISYLSQNQAMYDSIMGFVTSPWLWIAIIVSIIAVWKILTWPARDGSWLARLQGFVKGLWQGFAVIVKMPGKGRWLLLTLCIWGCYFSQLYVAFYAFPFTAQVLADYGIVVPLVAFTLSSIAMGVPSNGGIGPWQWSIVFALGVYGIDQLDSLAFANLVLGCQTLLLILLGIFTFVAIMLQKRRTRKIER